MRLYLAVILLLLVAAAAHARDLTLIEAERMMESRNRELQASRRSPRPEGRRRAGRRRNRARRKVVVIGGLVTATLLVLFVMPALYVMLARLSGDRREQAIEPAQAD